jgi:hypothetical protein
MVEFVEGCIGMRSKIASAIFDTISKGYFAMGNVPFPLSVSS